MVCMLKESDHFLSKERNNSNTKYFSPSKFTTFLLFHRLSISEQFNEECFQHIERFVTLLYDCTGSSSDVNVCRRVLFTSKGKDVESIPPTKDALKQHLLRAMLQAM